MSRIYLSPPEVGDDERRMLLDAFDSNWIAPVGPDVDAFEAELAERVGRRPRRGAVQRTAALHLALLLVGVGRATTCSCRRSPSSPPPAP